jgi:hypothetical protein
MNDRSKQFQIVLNVDAQVTPVPTTGSRLRRRRINVYLELLIRKPGRPTEDFELIDHSGSCLLSSGPGPKQEINLSLLPDKPIVTLHFMLPASQDLQFPPNVYEAIGLLPAAEGCPLEANKHIDRQFVRCNVSHNRKYVSLQDKNETPGEFSFALFVYQGAELYAVCDPRIINK